MTESLDPKQIHSKQQIFEITELNYRTTKLNQLHIYSKIRSKAIF